MISWDAVRLMWSIHKKQLRHSWFFELFFCRRSYDDSIFSTCYLYQNVDMLSANLFKKFLIADQFCNEIMIQVNIPVQIDFKIPIQMDFKVSIQMDF